MPNNTESPTVHFLRKSQSSSFEKQLPPLGYTTKLNMTEHNLSYILNNILKAKSSVG